jgi:hypothetical protein
VFHAGQYEPCEHSHCFPGIALSELIEQGFATAKQQGTGVAISPAIPNSERFYAVSAIDLIIKNCKLLAWQGFQGYPFLNLELLQLVSCGGL